MKKKITLALIVCLLSMIGQQVLAVSAVPWPIEKTQPDGTKITVHIRGDEKAHWFESLDGYTLMYNTQQYLVYATQDADKNMVPSAVHFSNKSVAPAGVAKGLLYSPTQMRMFEKVWEMIEDETPQRAAPTGSRKALCILMDFPDRPWQKSSAELEILFNQVGLYNSTSKGSVKDFFLENSYGKLDLTVSIAGPYTLANNASYYAQGYSAIPSRYQDFAREAINAAFNDGIDLTEFANDEVNTYGTHTLESFHILFAGYGAENTGVPATNSQIWSHKWQFTAITLGGVRISTYSCSPELRDNTGNNTTYIGVICHELTHTFGSPDYYDTGSTGYAGSGNWDLMANGSWNDRGRQPSHINMFQKTLFNWVTPTELTSYTEVNNMPNSAMNPVAYKIMANTNGEHYLLENRQLIGFDASLQGHGLLIWHVHQNALNGNGSNSGHPQQVYPVVASSTYQIPTATVNTYGSVNSAGTPFPGSANKQQFTSKTTPAMFTWVNTQVIAKPLTEITETGDLISFKFLDGPTTPVTNLTATESGGNVTLNWTAANHPDVEGYKVFRDGVLIYTINSATTTTYTQIGVVNGTYTYSVTAFYEFTESAPATATITVSSGSTSYSLPPIDLTGRTSLDKAWLNWTRPFNGGWMTIASQTNAAYYMYFDQPTTYFAGVLWGPEQLKGMDGYQITQIRFTRRDTDTSVPFARAQVWEVDAAGVPQLVRDQQWTNRTTGSQTLTLTSPYPIDASKEYIIGVQLHDRGVTTTGSMTLDPGPMTPGRNMFYDIAADEWYLFEDIFLEPGETVDDFCNFITAAYLSSGNPSSPNPDIILDGATQKAVSVLNNSQTRSVSQLSWNKVAVNVTEDNDIDFAAPALVHYNIFRDGVNIGTTTTLNFEDTGLTGGTTYSYCVSAEYAGGNVSEGVCIELKTLSPVNPFNPPENLKAVGVGDDITLTWDAPYTGGAATYVTSTAAPSTTTNANLANFTQAIRFDYNDMNRMEGFEITHVRFHSGNSTNRNCTVEIWSGGNGSTPGTLIYTEAVTSLTNNAFNNFQLTTPVAVNIYEDLWVTVKFTRTSGTNVSSPRYTGTNAVVVNGKSNLYHNGTTWSTTANVVWPITATIAPIGSLPPVTGYNISRNGTPLTSVSGATFTYLDGNLTPGLYNYCVTAEYTSNESDPVCTSATAEVPVNPYKAVENLDASLSLNNVTLSWEAPFKQGFFEHTTLATAGGFSINAIMAAKFMKEDLAHLLGTELSMVRFYIPLSSGTPVITTGNTTYTLRIYAGSNGDEPERMIYTQPITFANTDVGTWFDVNLTTPVVINVYEDLWIGIEASGTGASRCAVDAGPAITGKGNLIYYNNSWGELSGLSSDGNRNWNIRGYVTPASNMLAPPNIGITYNPVNMEGDGNLTFIPIKQGEAPSNNSPGDLAWVNPFVYATPDAYEITRDGVSIATVPNTVLTYNDLLTQTGSYTYCVTASYNSGADASETICADVDFVSECDAQPTNVTATLVGNKVELDWQFIPVVESNRVYFSEDFSAGIPGTWLNVDADADGQRWTANAGVGADGNTGYVYSASWNTVALTPDNWLITPQITNLPKTGVLSFYVMPFDANYPADHYGVYVSTTGTAAGDFTLIYDETLQAPAQWQKRSLDLSAFGDEDVYIAFRHFNCSDENRMFLDDISIIYSLFNIYEDGLVIDQVSDTHYEKYLADGGTFEYCVTFDAGYCESDEDCDDVTFSIANLFTPAPTQLRFAAIGGVGEEQDVTLTINDATTVAYMNTTYGSDFRVAEPVTMISWWNAVGVVYSFRAYPNTSGTAINDVIKIWFGTPTSLFSTDNGYEIDVLQKSLLLTGMLDYSLANRPYTGVGQSVNVTLNAAYSGLGAITVLYDGLPTLPVDIGTYVVSITALEGANFDAVTTPLVLGSFTIDPAPLTIRPYNATRPYGAPNPTFTAEFITLLGADTPASITGLTITTTATVSSPPGYYPITASGGVNPNYIITYDDGWLTVGTMDQTIEFPPLPNLYVGDVLYATATSSVGLTVLFSSDDRDVVDVAANGKITAIGVGTAVITAYNRGNGSYTAASASVTISVTNKPVVTDPDPETPPDDPTTGSEFVNTSNDVLVYPNPVTKSTPVYISADVDEALLVGAVITVYSETGSIVKNVQVTGKLTKVDLSVDSGTYIFVLKGKTSIIKTLKVIVK